MRSAIIKEFKNTILIILAILSAGMGIKGYLLANQFIDGGVTGTSMLLNSIFGWPLYILIPLINLPFIIVGFWQIGVKFAIRSALAILGLAICLAYVPYPNVTPDKLLAAVFGGSFLGLGIGLAIRAESVLDGTEVAALLISKNGTLKVADVILIVNVVIFTAALFTLGVESASYSILTYFAASKTIDFLLYGLEEYTGITIVSDKSEAIRQAITTKLDRGVTVYSGKGGHGKRGSHSHDMDIIFTVVTRLEVGKLKTIVRNLDSDAFMVQHSISDMQGGKITRRSLH